MNTVTRPKRGARFVIVETGEEISLDRIKENGEYFMTFDNGNFESFWPHELKTVQKQRTAISSKPKKQIDKTELNNFFAKEALKVPLLCDNCNQKLNVPGFEDKRKVIAHILPKKINFGGFPSIATNPDNVMHLGVWCGCHSKWDNSDAAKRMTMNCYAKAIERFEIFKDCLTDNEFVRALTYLGIEFK